ncbi:MAG: hypothetical protein JSW52_07650 [Candidatus Coatesbacteria bacterium]|nr:MAG: hypothetical protein JSW52_07650 [Candidatus Coatesbacteria bacterium]
MRIMSCVAIMLAFMPIYAFPSDVTPAGGEEGEVLAIDEETAAKLAMVASYHATYGRASAQNLVKFGKSERVLVDVMELASLDGEEKFYSITLYRGEGEPEDFDAIKERIPPGGEIMASYAEKGEDGKYHFEPPPIDEMREVFFFDTMDEYLEYYSSVVPASTDQGFLRAFRQGISPYESNKPLAMYLLAKDLGVDPGEVTVERITPEFDYVFDVSGSLYVVRLGFFDARKTAEIIPYEAGLESLAGTEEYEAVLPDVDVKGRDEDIVFWLDTARRVEEKFGFGEGPSVAAESVNPVLMGRKFKTLYQKGKSKIMMFSSEDREEEPE